jgi:hypothetical protein
MRYEEIEIGQYYNINYIDTNYPCRCACHTNANILHCIPCCYDMSYSGSAKCYDKYPTGLIDLLHMNGEMEQGDM